jgi:hypothetical protein
VGKSTLRRRLTDDRYVPYRPPTTLDIPYWVQTLQVEGLAVTLHRTSLSHGQLLLALTLVDHKSRRVNVSVGLQRTGALSRGHFAGTPTLWWWSTT